MMQRLLAFVFLFGVVVGGGYAQSPTLPAEKELRTLTRDSLLSFNKAVQTNDFTEFHRQTSELWRGQITPAKLKTIFQDFIEKQADLSPIASLEPTFQPAPAIDSDGVLVLQGWYPTSPSRLVFRLKYVNERDAWKLIGIKVDVKRASPADVKLPTEAEAKALVRESLLAFNQAVQAKSFVAFHANIAQLWQKQITAAKLQELFQPFIDGEVDIRGVAKVEPTFTSGRAIDEDGLLAVEGFYPTKPSQVHFSLAYLFETPQWKLVKVNVRVKNAEDADE